MITDRLQDQVLDTHLLKQKRKERFGTLHGIETAFGKTKGLFSQYENNKAWPTLKTFKRLCLLLQVSADKLLGLKTKD